MPDAFHRSNLVSGDHDVEPYPAPLTKPKSEPGLLSSPLSSAVALAQKARTLPLGAVLGLAIGLAVLVGLHYLAPAVPRPASMVGLFLGFCIFAGIGVERSLHLLFGWSIDPKRRFLQDKRNAELKLGRLHELEQAGLFDPVRVKRLAERIAIQELFGLPKPRGPRGQYRKRQPPPALPADPSGPGRPVA
jgi:hypothetical protein